MSSKYVPLEKRRELRKAAMPQVKALVKRYGRTAIAACLSNLKEHDKTLKRIASLRKEAAELEKQI